MSLIVFSAALVIAGAANAGGGPHGGYTPSTDACALCHRGHTSSGPGLLNASNEYGQCIACHGSAGAGANTNVDDGFYLSTRDDLYGNGNIGGANTPDLAPLLGGGFVNYLGTAVTSSHDPTGTTGAAWGNKVDRGLTATIDGRALFCDSCHEPHGSPNYRIIKEVVNGTAVSVAQVDEGPTKDYDTEQWGAGMSSFCGACHFAYYEFAAAVGQSTQNQHSGGGFTHRIDMPWNGDSLTDPDIGLGSVNPETVGFSGYTLPLAETGTVDRVVCTTCHFAHGTSAQMVGYADPTYDPAGHVGPIPAGDSSLLRLDNRGVCEVCHQK